MNMKRNILISVIIIVILAAYLLVNRFYTKSKVRLPEVKEITQIIINKGNQQFTITRHEDVWKVNGYEADKNVISNMENKLKNLIISDVVSEKPHYERFELDPERAIRVKAFCDNKVVRDLYIGKKGSTYRHTYIRLEGDPKVYLAEDTLDTYFNKTLDDLRNKDIVQIDIAKIESVKLWYKNTTLTLNKTIVEKKKEQSPEQKEKSHSDIEKEEQWVCKEYPNVLLDNDKVKEILYTFDPLKAYSFPDVDQKALQGKIASVTVSIKRDDASQNLEEISLTIHKEYENHRYLCTSSKSQYPFTMDEWRAKRVFKTIGDLKK